MDQFDDGDVHQETVQMGFSFSTPYIYGGLTFSGVPEYFACAGELLVYSFVSSWVRRGWH